MENKFKRVAMYICIFFAILCTFITTPLCVLAATPAAVKLHLTEEQQEFIFSSLDNPIPIGIIPHAFPLSDCPPEVPDFTGLNVEMLSMISEISGLNFEYKRIPLEEETPYQMLQEGTVSLVAGTIKLDTFRRDSNLILSDRLCDGSAACIAKKGTNPSTSSTGKIAVMKGYQAGFEFAEELFPSYKIIPYPNNLKVMQAVRTDLVDLAIISRYVGIYDLQSPLNEDLTELTLYKMENDSCVMGIRTKDNLIAISIINKTLSAIGEDGYNNMQMNFTLRHPYKPTITELIYKYRHILVVSVLAVIGFIILTVRLISAQREHTRLALDPLTGAFSEAGFELATAKILPKASNPLFITDFDISHFSSYNELNGKSAGDELLKDIVKIVKSLLCEQDAICRSYADHFKVLSSKDSVDHLIVDLRKFVDSLNEATENTITLNFGIYPISDKTVPITKMLDFAAMARKNIKNSTTAFVGIFNEDLLERYVSEAKMTSAFQNAITNKEFVAYYQPKYDAAQQTIIGAEALVRWVAEDGTLIPPLQFIELFEKSGQIQQLDFYMLEQVCIFLNNLIAKGIPALPIAVNFSRVHLYSSFFIDDVNQIVERYHIPKYLIEIECTETTMLNNIYSTQKILGGLQEQGFSIAMDDFGSAYSSLNTLCSIPLDVIKLDSGFLIATLSNEKAKANIIIRNVMTLAHDLSLKVVAEGVETEEQYQFLKSLGCDFIQGYYFSKPLEEARFLELLT